MTVPRLGPWIDARLLVEECRVSAAGSDISEAKARRRVEALVAVRDDPELDDLRAGVVARLVEGERTEAILRWLAIEILARRILAGPSR